MLLTYSYRFLICNKLGQLEFKQKKIIGIQKHAGNVRKNIMLWRKGKFHLFPKNKNPVFSNFPCMQVFQSQLIFPSFNFNFSDELDQRNLQEKVEQLFCFKIVLTFNCSNKMFQRSQISKLFLNHQNVFFLTVGQNNFGNKISFLLALERLLLT